jgi:hypothetical protein
MMVAEIATASSTTALALINSPLKKVVGEISIIPKREIIQILQYFLDLQQ